MRGWGRRREVGQDVQGLKESAKGWRCRDGEKH